MRPAAAHPRAGRFMVTLVLAALAIAAWAVRADAQTPTPVANPNFNPQCGTKVILVLDESGSITTSTSNTSNVRTAARAFAAGLADTGSQLAIVEFDTTARRAFNYTNVTSGTVLDGINGYIDGTTASPLGQRYAGPGSGGWTNWQDAMDEVGALNTSGGVAPLVVFITDGDPTAYNTAMGVVTNASSSGLALTNAITAANSVKTQGSHILAVGVGAALDNSTSRNRLVQVSGPDVATTTAQFNISTTDVFAVSDFSNLAATLREVVTQLCRSSVTVTKQVDDGNGYVNAGAGWEFTGNVTSGLQSWVQPAPTGAGATRTGSTDATSTVTFQWRPSGTSSNITLTETQKPGYDLDAITCVRGENNTPVAITQNGLNWSLAVGQTDVVKCTVKNRKRATIVVKKTMVGGTGSFAFTGSPSGTISANGGTLTASVAPGTYTSVEGAAPAGT